MESQLLLNFAYLNSLKAWILPFMCFKGLRQWKLVAITNGNYNNIFYKTRLFCSSYFLIKEWYYILSDAKWSGGAACPHSCPHQGSLEELVCFFWGGRGERVGEGSGVKIISYFGDIICLHYKVYMYY